MSKSPITYLLLFCCSLFSYSLFSQTTPYQITGKVVDEAAKPLAGATVSLVDMNGKELKKISSDSTGLFKMAYSNDAYKITVSYTGYTTFHSPLIKKPLIDLGTIILSASANTLGEVVVESKQNLVEVSAGSIIYNVARSIDAQGSNALEALSKAPGVFVNTDNSIILNGKGNVMVLIDGRQTYLSLREVTDLLKSMPASNIKSFEIINSPTAKYDAAGSSGIINIKTIKSGILGLNGTTTTGVSYGVHARQNQDISLNYRKNKYNVYGSYNHFIGYYNYLYGTDRMKKNKKYQSTTDDTDK